MARRRGHGEGSIYQRKEGRWEGKLDLGYVGGRRRRKSVYGETQKEVQDKLLRVRAQLRDGLPIPPERQTVANLLDHWLLEAARTVRPRTLEGYRIIVENHLKPALGRRRLTRLTPEDVSALLDAKLADDLSPSTVRSIHAVLRRALNVSLRWGHVGRNVAALVDPPRNETKEVQPLSIDEAAGLLDAVSRDRLAAIYQVALALGLRRGEILGLRWDDVDLDAETISVKQSLQRVGGSLKLTELKTASSRRAIALPTVITAALRAHRSRQLAERLAAGGFWQDSGLVFTTRQGGPIEPRNLTRHFHRVLKQAGLPRRPFHHLRHTCASLSLAQGVHPRDIMEVLGHSRIATTMDLYAHVQEPGRQAVAREMDAALATIVASGRALQATGSLS